MKKQPASVSRTRNKSSTKTGKATKTPVAAKSTRKKVVARKGITHHTKRLYHLTPKFIHGMVAGAIVGGLIIGILSAAAAFNPSSTSAASKCDAHGIGNNTLTHSTNNSAYTITGNKTTVTFDVVGKGCRLPVTIVVWKAPNGTTGKPYAAQTLFMHASKTFSEGRHQLTATLPDCYFQVDTVTGTKLTGSTGQAYNYDGRQVAFMHGGKQSCAAKPVVSTPTPVTPVTPVTPTTPTTPVVVQVCDLESQEVVPIEKTDFDSSKYSTDLARCQDVSVPGRPVVESASVSVETLPATGAGAVILIGILSVAGGIISHKLHHHTRKKRHAKRLAH